VSSQTSSFHITGPQPEINLHRHTHSVQFYSDDTFLIDVLSRFMGSAIGAGDAAVVIATQAHRDELAQRLAARGLDVARAVEQGRYVALDAAETLAQFMVDDWPDEKRFLDLIGGVISRAKTAAQSEHGRAALFGEMVALLWDAGNSGAALRLEQLWNQIAQSHLFSLVCAYPLAHFYREEHGELFQQICAEHSAVVPDESYALASEEQRLRSVARWQQKALALEAEVDQRAQAEMEARKLAAIVESSDDAIASKDLNGIVSSWNSAAERMFGYKAAEIVGKPVTLIIPPELHKDEPIILGRIRRGERIDHFETVRVTKSGKRIDVSLTVSPVRNEKGEVVGAAKIVRDITERKQTERYLATQYSVTNILAASTSLNEAAQQVLETMCRGLRCDFGALWQVNEPHRLLTCLQTSSASAFPQLAKVCSGSSFHEGVGLPGRVWETREPAWIHDLRADHNLPRGSAIAAEGFKSAFAFPIELREKIDGVIEFFSRDTREMDDKLVEMMTAIGSQLGQFLERKRAEGALLSAEKLAVAGRMALTISHEINNPLEAVTNALFLLRSQVGQNEGLQYLAIAESELERVSHIAKQTLAFYTEQVSPEPVEVTALLDGVISVLAKKVAQKRLLIVRRDQSCSVRGLKTELYQLFLNLLDNAADAAPVNGKVEISVSQHESKVVVSIADNGSGISSEHLARLFEPFFSTKQHLGTGLGLWVARQIAERHDGSINAESRTQSSDHGTTFRVTLGGIREANAIATTAA
jgi:PAS domain S-box-containing protein